MTHDASDAGLHSCGRLNERSTYHHATTTRHVVSEVSFLFKIIIGSKSLYCKYSTAQKNGLYAFGNRPNSAESKPIWMKSGTV